MYVIWQEGPRKLHGTDNYMKQSTRHPWTLKVPVCATNDMRQGMSVSNTQLNCSFIWQIIMFQTRALLGGMRSVRRGLHDALMLIDNLIGKCKRIGVVFVK